MDTLTKEKIIANRKLLKQNAPVIYQLFVARKLNRESRSTVMELSKQQDSKTPHATDLH